MFKKIAAGLVCLTLVAVGDDEAELLEYEITDGTLTMDQGGQAIVWTKSNQQIVVPKMVTLFDGYTSVDRHSWGEIKAALVRG